MQASIDVNKSAKTPRNALALSHLMRSGESPAESKVNQVKNAANTAMNKTMRYGQGSLLHDEHSFIVWSPYAPRTSDLGAIG